MSAGAAINRPAITVCVILATLLQSLDTTIANVALPYMQGSVSASQDQIAWVLTSYIAAAAIMTPPTGFLASRFGLKRLFIVSVLGFTIASMLCGISQSLLEIVLSRVLQGLFGAALVPLSQSVLMNINPPEKQGQAMAIFGVAVMVGPILGPVLGGWLTENYDWRWVFFINLPIGALAAAGLATFLFDTPRVPGVRLDWLGFASLSLGIGALQVMLDRGEELDWFSSREILVEAVLAGSAFYVFLVHTFTAREPFIRPSLFRDRNFAAGVLFIAVVGITYYSSLALQPPYLQGLMNYPVVTAGLVMGPRGAGTMAAMMIVGRLIGVVDTRVLLAFGLGATGWSFYAMTGWTPDISQASIVVVGIVQGLGLGFLFVPLSTATLATLSREHRTEGAGIYNLSRNIGSSIGISAVNTFLTRNTIINHAELAAHLQPTDPGFADPATRALLNPTDAGGRAALDTLVTGQAQIIAYIDDYKLLMVAVLVTVPLLLVFRRPARAGQAARDEVMLPE